MVTNGFCKEEDLDLFIVTDDTAEAVAYIKKHVII